MPKQLAGKLKRVRAQLGNTQAEFAARLGVPYKTLVNWEQERNVPNSLALEALNAKLDGILKAGEQPKTR